MVKAELASSMGPGKRVMELEEVSNWLEEENFARRKILKQIDKLYVEVAAMRAGEERWTMAEETWAMAYEKCRDLESEKGKVEMDLKAAMAENKSLRRTLEEKDGRITTLVNEKEHIDQRLGQEIYAHRRRLQLMFKEKAEKLRLESEEKMKVDELRHRIDVLEKENGGTKAEVIKLEKEISRQKKQVSNEKMTTKDTEKKMTQLMQRIKALEEENVTLKAEKMTVKEEGDKKILELAHKFDMLDKEKQRLEEEFMQRIDVIKVFVQEKECLDAKLQQLKTEINKWTVSVKSEDNADLPRNNLCISGDPAQSQGKQSAKRARPST